MPENHTGSSKVCRTASYGSPNKEKGKNTSKYFKIIVIDDDKGKLAKVALIMKAASVLAQSFVSTITSSNTAKISTLYKDKEIKKALLEADEVSKIVSNNNGLDKELTHYKIQYLGQMSKKLRTLLEME